MANPETVRVNFFEIPPESFNGKIPFILTDVIAQLVERHADDVEGIFRLNGHDGEMVDLIARLGDGPLATWPSKLSLHSLAGTVKRYLRKLSEREPFIPHAIYNEIMSGFDAKDTPRSIALLKQLMNRLSPVRRKMLNFLFKYLNDIVQKSGKNKMTPANLAVCVSQVILIAHKGLDPMEMQRHIGLGSQAVSWLIVHCDEIFGDTLSQADICTAEDLEPLRALRLTLPNVNHLMTRDSCRRESLIPWGPACRVERRPCYARPVEAPAETVPVELQSRVEAVKRMDPLLDEVFRASLGQDDRVNPLRIQGAGNTAFSGSWSSGPVDLDRLMEDGD
jgi:hypothetical protein